jgi:osmotically-inducible protein OsmY
MPNQYERYRGEPYRREPGYRREERGVMDRAGDEVRSWFGDDEAERRRRLDEREAGYGDYGRPSGYGRGYDPYGRGAEGRAYGAERGWDYEGVPDWGERWGTPERSGRDYERGYGGSYGPYGTTGYGTRYGRTRFGGGYGETSRPSSERYAYAGERGWPGTFAGRGPKGYQRSDDRIREDVCDRLADAPDIDASEIEVNVRNGEVTLSGSVRERDDKRRTEDLVENISGVREVHNTLRVSWPQEQGATPSVTGAAAPKTAAGGATR